MDHADSATLPRARFALAALLAALAVTACGGGSSTAPQTTARQLSQRGAAWGGLSPGQRATALRACRLERAVAAAKDGGARRAPYFNARYAAVQQVQASTLQSALGRWFAQSAHRDQTIAAGCAAVLARMVDLRAFDRRPRADFASPVSGSRRALRLAVGGPVVRLQARVTPARARLRIGPAPDRAVSTARITVRQQGTHAVADLRAIPRGVSYLRVSVRSGGRGWDRLLMVRRRPTPRLPAPRTFAPIVISGQGSRGLPLLYLPRPGLATVSTDGSPLSLTSGDTVLLAHAPGDHDRRIPIDSGRYRDVRVTATGGWTIRIVPAPGGGRGA